MVNLMFEEEYNLVIVEKYVKDIIYENYTDQIQMAEQGRLLGIEVDRHCFAAVTICFREKYEPDEAEKKALQLTCENLRQYLRAGNEIHDCHYIPLEKGYLLLVEGTVQPALELFINGAEKELMKEISNCLKREQIVVGIGTVGSGLKAIRNSYSCAWKAIHVGGLLYPSQNIYYYNNLKAFCALEDILVKTEGSLFTEVLIGIKNQELLDTLICYYECDASLDEVAAVMYTHKNTIKYRLNRIQDMTGLDLKKTDDNFKLYLAVLALRLRA